MVRLVGPFMLEVGNLELWAPVYAKGRPTVLSMFDLREEQEENATYARLLGQPDPSRIGYIARWERA
jgi:hypothetical protein